MPRSDYPRTEVKYGSYLLRTTSNVITPLTLFTTNREGDTFCLFLFCLFIYLFFYPPGLPSLQAGPQNTAQQVRVAGEEVELKEDVKDTEGGEEVEDCGMLNNTA